MGVLLDPYEEPRRGPLLGKNDHLIHRLGATIPWSCYDRFLDESEPPPSEGHRAIGWWIGHTSWVRAQRPSMGVMLNP